jgi:hypothetical protein
MNTEHYCQIARWIWNNRELNWRRQQLESSIYILFHQSHRTSSRSSVFMRVSDSGGIRHFGIQVAIVSTISIFLGLLLSTKLSFHPKINLLVGRTSNAICWSLGYCERYICTHYRGQVLHAIHWRSTKKEESHTHEFITNVVENRFKSLYFASHISSTWPIVRRRMSGRSHPCPVIYIVRYPLC